MPVRNRTEETIGALQVLNKQQGVFGTEDEEVLKAVAARAAIAIETAQLIGGYRISEMLC
jgi:GAF domain-containing protein